jgi:hypothetical protein
MDVDENVSQSVRLIGVYATNWRRPAMTASSVSSQLLPELGVFIDSFAEQLPRVHGGASIDPAELAFPDLVEASPEVATLITTSISTAELLLLTLPFPADQVVATLIVDVGCPDVREDDQLVRELLKVMARAAVTVGDVSLSSYLDDLCGRDATMKRKRAQQEHGDGLPAQRHQLLFVRHDGDSPTPTPSKDVVESILYGSNEPYRPEFSTHKTPEGLNRAQNSLAAVSADASIFYGQPKLVETSVFLTTVQAVGTASRFNQIWQDAYFGVKKFQDEQQRAETGTQERKDLEELADQMGNLELDLAFSVEAAAELGAPVPSYSITTFHDDLYEVMQIRARAGTVSQMFVRLGGSIRSELTAIESRERQEEERRRKAEELKRLEEENRRFRATLAISAVGVVAIPFSVIAGFFGINASQVDPNRTMWSYHHYLWIYVIAVLTGLVPILGLSLVYGSSLVGRISQIGSRSTDPHVLDHGTVR